MIFELWDIITRNMIVDYEIEEEALLAVRYAVIGHGQDYAAALALVREDSRGRMTTLATGLMLVERALALAA